MTAGEGTVDPNGGAPVVLTDAILAASETNFLVNVGIYANGDQKILTDEEYHLQGKSAQENWPLVAVAIGYADTAEDGWTELRRCLRKYWYNDRVIVGASTIAYAR